MEHVAIDLGKKESQLCVRDETGKIIKEERVATEEIGSFLRRHPTKKRVVMETCAEAFDVADEVLELGHEVRVVAATLSKKLGVGYHGVKTDRRDAQALSRASVALGEDLGSVHIPSGGARERKSNCGDRDALVAMRTKAVNHVRGYLRTHRMTVKAGSALSFVKRVRKKLSEGRLGLSMSVERVLRTIEFLSEQITEADKELRGVAKADKRCALLMTMPGVGVITSLRFTATIDQAGRFPNGHRMQSYLGLTPGERSSSERKQRTGITKAGSTALRWVLVQAAWSLWRTRPKDPMVTWAAKIAGRRSKSVAIVALARKMASVLRAMWRDGKPYDPIRIFEKPERFRNSISA